MGEAVSVTGMVLSAMQVNDYDRRVVLLTRERGRITAFAKGARRMNSQLMGRTNPFCFGSFSVYEGRNSYTIVQARIDNYFEQMSKDMDAICYGTYFLELADYYTYENMDAVNELNLLYAAFKTLIGGKVPKTLVRYVFELKMMVFHGTYPQCFQCHHCNSEEKLQYFSALKGGVLCEECAKEAEDAISIAASTLYTLQYIIATPVKKLFTFTVSQQVLTELRMITARMSLLYIDRKFKSLEMLELTNFS